MSLIALPVACRVDGKAMDGVTSLLPDLQGGPLGLRLGPELAANGGFDDTSAWTLPSGNFNISGGMLRRTANGSTETVSQTLGSLVAGRSYLIIYTVSAVSGTDNRHLARLTGSGVYSTAIMSGVGTFAQILTPFVEVTTVSLLFTGGYLGDVDMFSIREVL